MRLRDDWERFAAAGLQIVAIGQGSAAATREFAERMELPFPLLADPRREAYRAYGLTGMQLRRELHPSSLMRGLQAARRYGAAAAQDQDPRQLGGVFVIDTEGVIRYAFRQQRMSDVPTNDALLRALVAS